MLALMIKIAAIGIAGPVLEELIFRGFLIFLLRRKGLKTGLVIFLTALVWSGMHWNYEPALIGMIFVDGLVLGLIRVKTGSLWVPITLHVMANLFSIYQSVTAMK